MIKGISYFIIVLSWVLLIFSFNKDRSRYRNCYFLFFAIVFPFFVLLFSAGSYQGEIIKIVVTLLILIIFVVPFFLIINGVLMLKREGYSLANLLSLIFGIIIGLGETAAFLTILLPWNGSNHLSSFSMFFAISIIYVSMSFVIFMLYCVFLQLIPRKKNFDYIIIHGAGLIDGKQVSKLLADRLDKAIDVYNKAINEPIMIPSGGRGSDERISEADAMKEYLIKNGIPEERIITEDQSTTTFENLRNAKQIIDRRDGCKNTVLVTSNYHVYRALRYCRKIKLKCVGVGSRVAFYYWPSAMIREYIAVHAEKKHLICLVLGWLLWMIPLVTMYY